MCMWQLVEHSKTFRPVAHSTSCPFDQLSTGPMSAAPEVMLLGKKNALKLVSASMPKNALSGMLFPNSNCTSLNKHHFVLISLKPNLIKPGLS